MKNAKRLLIIIALIIPSLGNSKYNILIANEEGNQNPINFEVYPNPVLGDDFTITSEIEVTEVTVLNILGQNVLTKKYIGETRIFINLEARDSGLFIVKVKTIDGRVATKRVLFK